MKISINTEENSLKKNNRNNIFVNHLNQIYSNSALIIEKSQNFIFTEDKK